jgi:hypothetical protein
MIVGCMIKKLMMLFLFVLFLITLVSCIFLYGHAVQVLLDPENAKKIYVKPFINDTDHLGLEVRFTNAVADEIIMDGRLSLVNNEVEADVVFIYVIRRYILQTLTYDMNMLPEYYKLWIIGSTSLIDKNNGAIIWSDPNFKEAQIYVDTVRSQNNVSMTDEMTEEEAVEIICDKISKNIVKKIIKSLTFIN